jgi:hypothetical protein
MRTVTFSSDNVRNHLNNNFVCTMVNTTGDPSAGASCKHAPTDTPGPCSRGIGHQNVQSLFLTPAGEIFHAASGYLSAEDMDKELSFGSDLYALMKRTPAQARQIVTQAHARRLKELGYSDAEIKQPRQNFFGGSGLVLFGNQNDPNPNGGNRQSAQSSQSSAAQRTGNGRANLQRPGGGGGGGFGGFGGGAGGGFGFPDGANPFNPFGGAQGGNFMDQMLAFQTKRTVLNDHKFSIEHPLLPMSEFMKRPQILVGNEKTAFMSVGSGGVTGK